MNVDKIIKFPVSGIFAHPLSVKELQKLIKKHDSRGRVLYLVRDRFEWISNHNEHDVTLTNKYVEHLKHVRGFALYSIHIRTKDVNLRILYCYLDDIPILLSCFYEKEKADYVKGIDNAKNRRFEIL